MATQDSSGSRAADQPTMRVNPLPLADRKALGVCSLIVGLGLVYFVGFTPNMAVHNAAHDTRHASAFPCH
jgi:cobalt transporter subunit CbtB